MSRLWMLGLLMVAGEAQAYDKAALGEALSEALEHSSLDGAEVAVLVQDLDRDEVVWERNPDLPLNPASCQKLLTTLAVLDTLGPSYSFSTKMMSTAELEDGVLDGDLYVVGSGDPGMVVERWWKLAADLRTAGVERITGDLILDEGLIGEATAIPGWPGGDDGARGPAYEAPISGLSVNYNSVGIRVGPGARAGEPAQVGLEPPTSYLRVDNRAETSAGGRRKIEVIRTSDEQGPLVVIKGTVPLKASSKSYYRNIPDPVAYAGTSLREAFTRWGGVLEGEVRAGEVDKEAELIMEYHSRPNWMLVGDMNKFSSNQIAELLLRTAARRANGDASPESAVRLLEETLESRGIDLTGALLLNGSGLTREGRVTPRQLVGVVEGLREHPRWAPEALASMALYGQDGTVHRRLPRNREVRGYVRVKTGSVTGVLTLAGYVLGPEGEALGFALMFNDLRNTWEPKPVWDDFVLALFEALHDEED